jgi:HPt (histidine-containing phosphotransfer) domain-containing protein
VVPIARFYPDDGAPGILHRAPAPATTVARRFRDAMAAVGARAGVEAARVLQDPEETRRALHELADVAESYGAASIAQLATRMARAPLTSPEEREAVLALAALLQERTLTEPQLAQAVREAGARFGSHPETAAADVVPIETLLYRGHAALARARTVRDALQGHWQRGTLAEPAAHALFEELSELLDLAGTP